MFFFKPNIKKLTKKKDVQGLIKAFDFGNEKIQREALDALIGFSESETDNSEVIDSVVKAMKGWPNSIMKEMFLSLRKDYGTKHEFIKGIAQGLHFPITYPKSKVRYEGNSIPELIKKLSSAMKRMPKLPKEQIYFEYGELRGSHLWKTNSLLGDTPQGLQIGLFSDAKEAIQQQLLADMDWLTVPKTSFRLESGGWKLLIQTIYARGYVVLYYPTVIWRSTQEDGKNLFFYSFSPERNW
jgi:hypothetical protein